MNIEAIKNNNDVPLFTEQLVIDNKTHQQHSTTVCIIHYLHNYFFWLFYFSSVLYRNTVLFFTDKKMAGPRLKINLIQFIFNINTTLFFSYIYEHSLLY